MNTPLCFGRYVVTLASLMVLAACVPNENAGGGVLMASSTTSAASAPMTDASASQDEGAPVTPLSTPDPIPDPIPDPVPDPVIDPNRLMGLDPVTIMELLGQPVTRRLDGNAQVYGFVSAACRVNAYFMRAGEAAPFLLNHVEFQTTSSVGGSISGISCLSSFYPDGAIPGPLLKQIEPVQPAPEQR